MKIGRIVFLKSSFGNCAGDIVDVREVDSLAYYYYDGFRRWCYVEKNDPYIKFIPPGTRINWKKMIEPLLKE